MRLSYKITGLIAMILISFAAGVFVAACLHLGSPIATVNLHNASGKEIVSLRLVHEHGIIEIANLAVDATRIVRFYAPGESGYKISLVFSDGKSLESSEGYVEAGYLITETITDKEIKSEFYLSAY
jgi:hypothetical protein